MIEIDRYYDDPFVRQRIYQSIAALHANFSKNHSTGGMESFLSYLVDLLHRSNYEFAFADGTPYDPIKEQPSSKVLSNFLRFYGTPEEKGHKDGLFRFLSCVEIARSEHKSRVGGEGLQAWLSLYRERYTFPVNPAVREFLNRGLHRLAGTYGELHQEVGETGGVAMPHLMHIEKIPGEPFGICHLLWQSATNSHESIENIFRKHIEDD